LTATPLKCARMEVSPLKPSRFRTRQKIGIRHGWLSISTHTLRSVKSVFKCRITIIQVRVNVPRVLGVEHLEVKLTIATISKCVADILNIFVSSLFYLPRSTTNLIKYNLIRSEACRCLL